MDKIAEAKLFVEENDLVCEMLVTCLNASRISSEGTKIIRVKLENSSEVILYPTRNIYPEGDKSLKLAISNQKLDKIIDFLKNRSVEFFLQDKHLTWGTNNGSIIEFVGEK